MHQARFVLAAAGAALVAACGGKVTVDAPGGVGGSGSGGSASTASTGSGGTTFDSTAASGNASSSSGGATCLNSCAEVLSKGGAVCSFNGLASMNYTALYTCGCGPSPCAMACNFSLCTSTQFTMECAACLGGACADALKICEGS